MNQVASYLGISENKVRDENLHTPERIRMFYGEETVGGEDGFTLPAIWDQVKVLSNLETREDEIRRFNEQSKWLKRGISLVPSVHGVANAPIAATVSIFQDGSIVLEVGGVEMGQGLYTKVRQEVAYSLRPLWNKRKDVDMVSNIRILQQDSLSLPNTFCDGGSTTSEGSCAAASQACETLVERLQPVKENLAKVQGGDVSWESICMTARQMFIDLQCLVLWAPPTSGYLLFGAGVSEVEINVMSGETRILTSDLVYDAGKSLNAAVDIGQVEGAFVMEIGFFSYGGRGERRQRETPI